jgi:hypothetical protein
MMLMMTVVVMDGQANHATATRDAQASRVDEEVAFGQSPPNSDDADGC